MIRRYLLSVIFKSDWTLKFSHKVYLNADRKQKSLSRAQEEVDKPKRAYTTSTIDMDMDCVNKLPLDLLTTTLNQS